LGAHLPAARLPRGQRPPACDRRVHPQAGPGPRRASGAPPLSLARARAALLALLLAPACARDRLPGGLLAREALLERQIQELSLLGRATERGGFLPKDQLVVAVSERLANALAALALPREQVVAGRYRVRLETADVRFRGEHGSVRFEGRVSPVESLPQDFAAQIALFGAVDTVELERATGVL